jgi:hypothetical protein
MPDIEPAGEKIVRNLQHAVERLQGDIQRVELWARALGCFSKPIPDYDHGQTRFDLPPNKADASDAHDEPAERHREAMRAAGSPPDERRLGTSKHD